MAAEDFYPLARHLPSVSAHLYEVHGVVIPAELDDDDWATTFHDYQHSDNGAIGLPHQHVTYEQAVELANMNEK